MRYGKFTEWLIFPFSLSAWQPFFLLSAAPLAEAGLVPLNNKADMTSKIGLKLRPTDKTFGLLPQPDLKLIYHLVGSFFTSLIIFKI